VYGDEIAEIVLPSDDKDLCFEKVDTAKTIMYRDKDIWKVNKLIVTNVYDMKNINMIKQFNINDHIDFATWLTVHNYIDGLNWWKNLYTSYKCELSPVIIPTPHHYSDCTVAYYHHLKNLFHTQTYINN
jgi:hypothetical protein